MGAPYGTRLDSSRGCMQINQDKVYCWSFLIEKKEENRSTH